MERGFTDVLGEPLDLTRSTIKSAGYDLCAARDVVIPPHGMALIGTGVKVFMQDDEFLMLVPRSSKAIKWNLVLKNTIGVIDADYKDEIFIALMNIGDEPRTIEVGDRIAQAIFLKYLTTGDKPKAIRQGGLGSTGI